MTEQDIEDFLASQGVGVLALPTDDAPYVLPLSFGYDGDRGLYFTFVTGDSSRKADLSSGGQQATYLVYAAESPFHWRSVVCQGAIHEIPSTEWAAHAEAMDDNAWRPDIFERASDTERVRVYRFDVEDWSGLRHTGLPPRLENADR
jgi:nitroimidazol reductase NimA-like FMN-containing flavoprotein (pyridoxamine 5'-phosphate oxidase superfamily)